jgi:hypothetical protein
MQVTEEANFDNEPPIHQIFTPFCDSTAQIRLIRLLPHADFNDPVHAIVEIWDRNSAPPFSAVSYVWGEPLPQEAISIDGLLLPITPNCLYALKQVRLHHPQDYVWVDAICINQEDMEEKAAQVAMMGEIYAKATRVLACIGPADACSDIVLGAASNIDAVIQELPLSWFDEMDMRLWDPPQDETSTVQFLNTFLDFSERPYFNRVWIVQELFGGRGRTTILCGRDRLDWFDLAEIARRLLLIFGIWEDMPYKGFHGCDKICRLDGLADLGHLGDETSFAFPRYLEDMLSLDCRDPRDRIYGTIGMVNWTLFGQMPPIPDYDISPLQLASELLSRLIDPDMKDAFLIFEALNLSGDQEVVENLRQSTICSAASDIHTSRVRKWSIGVNRAHFIQQDIAGKLQVDLDFWSRDTKSSSKITDQMDGNETLPNTTALDPIFTGEEVSAVASGQVRPQDILVRAAYFDLVLRAHINASTFTVVGGALVKFGYSSHERVSNVCECMQQDWQKSEHERVKLAMSLTDEEVLAMWVMRGTVPEYVKRFDENVLTFIQNHALGSVKAGSLCYDTTASEWELHRTIAPVRPDCPLHRSVEYYKRRRHLFWYDLLIGDHAYLWVTR